MRVFDLELGSPCVRSPGLPQVRRIKEGPELRPTTTKVRPRRDGTQRHYTPSTCERQRTELDVLLDGLRTPISRRTVRERRRLDDRAHESPHHNERVGMGRRVRPWILQGGGFFCPCNLVFYRFFLVFSRFFYILCLPCQESSPGNTRRVVMTLVSAGPVLPRDRAPHTMGTDARPLGDDVRLSPTTSGLRMWTALLVPEFTDHAISLRSGSLLVLRGESVSLDR